MQYNNVENLVEVASSEEELSQLIDRTDEGEALEDGDCEATCSSCGACNCDCSVPCDDCSCHDTQETSETEPEVAELQDETAATEEQDETRMDPEIPEAFELSNVQPPFVGKMKLMREVGDWFYTNLYRAIDDMDEKTLDNTYHNWHTWSSTMDSISYLKDNFLRFQNLDSTAPTQKEQLSDDCEEDEDSMQTSPSDPKAYQRDLEDNTRNNEDNYSKNNLLESNTNSEEEIEIDMTKDELKELMRSVVAEATSNLVKENAELSEKLSNLQNKEVERAKEEELSELDRLRKENLELRKGPAAKPVNTVGNYEALKAAEVSRSDNNVNFKAIGNEVDNFVSAGRHEDAIKVMMRNGLFGKTIQRFYK